eukprot:5458160-Amphidinium_carterae.1
MSFVGALCPSTATLRIKGFKAHTHSTLGKMLNMRCANCRVPRVCIFSVHAKGNAHEYQMSSLPAHWNASD